MRYRNLAQMFFAAAARFSGRPRYRYRVGDEWREVSWDECAGRVWEIAAGLVDLGVAVGEKVVILSATRPEWVEVDLAILACGAITVPIYPASPPAECGYIFTNSEARVAVVESPAQLEKMRAVEREGFELEGEHREVRLGPLFLIEGEAEGARGIGELRRRGRERLAELRAEIERRVVALEPDELATIVYTSGTTGLPKGVMQTHANHLAAIEAVMDLGLVREGDVDFFFLPLAHSFARAVAYLGLAAGTITAFARGIDTVAQDLPAARPHLVPAVPRIYEKIYARVLAAREAGGALKRRIFDWAVSVGKKRTGVLEAGRRPGRWLALRYAVADRLVFRHLREMLGGQVRYMVSGAAPLAREIAEFFHAASLPVLEGYGLTETTPVLTANRPDRFRIGSVGRAVKGVELKLAPDGEILARGPNIAVGYFKMPAATAEAWDSEGWFHTGDVGRLDEDGFLYITDRKKDLIKTSGGKYVAPQKVENLLKAQPHISQALVVGEARKYCTALVTLDVEAVRRWAEAENISLDSPDQALCRHPAVQRLIAEEVAAVNRELASYESVKYFRILPRELSVEQGELTQTMKIKRKVVVQRYRDLIEEMYPS